MVARVSPDETLGRLLLAIALAIAVARLLSFGLRRAGQPPVLAEILAGVVLGPTVVGVIPGAVPALFPATVQSGLAAIGGIGLVLFMFMVGLELDITTVARHARRTAGISIGAIGLPFALGLGVAAALYEDHKVVAGHVVGRVPFSLFVAVALSLTAFPVLARILRHHQLERTTLGQTATTSAAVQDAAGWLLLAVALATMTVDGGTQLLRIAAETTALAVVLLWVVRPLLRRRCDDVVVFVGLAACAGATQLIGLHSVLGAFAFGLLIPSGQRPALVPRFEATVAPLTTGLLLPIYFLGPGLHVDLRAFGSEAFVALALVLPCAFAGKLLGAAIPARLAGASWSEARAIAVLLNTRGLVELIVLEVGRSEGILDPTLFSVFVTMALVTTLATGPLLRLLERGGGVIAVGHAPMHKSRLSP